MVKRRTPASSRDNEYTVGFGKPPVHSRFQPGQSGNPAGRRKGVRNLMTDVKRTLLKPVRLKEGGRTKKRSTQESILLVLREKALNGHLRAIVHFLELALRFNSDATDSTAVKPLAADDQAILDAYVAAVAEAADTPLTDPLPGRSNRKSRRQSKSDRKGSS